MIDAIKLGAAALLAATVSVASADTTMTGDLPRRADLGFGSAVADGGLVVRNLAETSAAYEAGLRDGDVIVAVDGRDFDKPYIGAEMLRGTDGGASVSITYQRDGDTAEARFTPPPMPLEDLDGVDTEYGVVETPDGARLRTIVTRPEGVEGPLPAIFFTQWVSCDSIETNRPGVWLGVLRGVIQRSGMVVIRVERSSGGDSEGPGCHELDYDTEVAHYRYAFDELTTAPGVDRTRVIIWGNSLGSTVAPLVAAGNEVHAIMVGGGGAQTYFERMVQFDRIGFESDPRIDPGEVDARMRRHAEFHSEYLLRGKDPAAIVAEFPHLDGVWSGMRGTGEGTHYGRPYDWHRQAARRDFLGAWVAFEGQALVMYPEYDQFEYAAGHQIIADTLNRLRPGSARYVVFPKMGHGYRTYESRLQAVTFQGGIPDVERAVTTMLDWLGEVSIP